jgi:hypothetical protein
VVTHSPQLFYASLYKFLQLSRLEAVRTNHPMQFHRSAANASLPHGTEKTMPFRLKEYTAGPMQTIGVGP